VIRITKKGSCLGLCWKGVRFGKRRCYKLQVSDNTLLFNFPHMPNYLFERFEEVEESIKRSAPKIVYKYRGDWNNPYHRKLITEQLMWFAPPKELNDPYDIRTPVRFDITEIEHPLFFQKL
jgi:hypothetical protein